MPSPPTFVADEVVTATKMNSLPKGILGWATTGTAQTGVSSITDLTTMSVTVTVGASRTVRVTGRCGFTQRTATGVVIAVIREGSTTLNEVGRQSLGVNEQSGMMGAAILTPTAGSHTYKLSVSTTAGTVDTNSNSSNNAWILVEDIGAA